MVFVGGYSEDLLDHSAAICMDAEGVDLMNNSLNDELGLIWLVRILMLQALLYHVVCILIFNQLDDVTVFELRHE